MGSLAQNFLQTFVMRDLTHARAHLLAWGARAPPPRATLCSEWVAVVRADADLCLASSMSPWRKIGDENFGKYRAIRRISPTACRRLVAYVSIR